MKLITDLKDKIFSLTKNNFQNYTLTIFRYQSKNNQIYKKYIELLKINPKRINRIEQIPFLPIEFFKTHRVISNDYKLQTTNHKLFISSGTTGSEKSNHFVTDISLYQKSILHCFEKFYESWENYCIIGVLPKRKNSSLVFMIDYLIKQNKHPLSGFYYGNSKNIFKTLKQIKNEKKLIIGISYCLIDFASVIKLSQLSLFKNAVIMETGGMKGKRKELTKAELHNFLKEKFGVKQIHSEYGMTELLSQAYSKAGEVFHCPPWMKILIRDANDPFSILKKNQTGGINIIDLANIHSCSFIATMDLGKLHEDGSFEILGRFDQSDLRGCNLMAE